MFCLSSGGPSDHAVKSEVQHLVDEGWDQLCKDFYRLKRSAGAVLKYLPKRVRDLFRHACEAVSTSGRRMGRLLNLSKLLNARDLHRQEEEDSAGSTASHMTSLQSGEDFSTQMK